MQHRENGWLTIDDLSINKQRNVLIKKMRKKREKNKQKILARKLMKRNQH